MHKLGRQFSRWHSLVGGVGLLLLLGMSLGACGGGELESESVKVAANLPITGPLAVWGESIRQGASFALEELEESGAANPMIEIDWQDNASDPSTAVTVLQQQLLTEPDLYVSGIKPQVMATWDRVTEEGLPNFVWIFDAEINETPKGNNLRTLVSYKIEAPKYLEYARHTGAQRIAIVYVELPHTLDQFQRLVIPNLEEMGAEVLEERYDFGRQSFRDIAVRVQDFHPDLVVLNGFQPHLVGLLRALRPLGGVREGGVIGTFDMIDAAKILGPDEVEGVRVVAPVFETRPNSGPAGEWRARFRDRFGMEPLYIHAFAYDMATIIADTARRLELPATSEEWLTAIRDTNTEGVTGPLRFDSLGNLVTPVEIGVFRNGRLVPDTAPSKEDTPERSTQAGTP